MRALAEIVAPLACVSCGTEGSDELCTACASAVRVVARPWCERCGSPGAAEAPTCRGCADLGGFAKARSVVVFADAARGLTLQLKRRGRRRLASAIGELLAATAYRDSMLGPHTVVAWVPGGRSTRRTGFDHARLMAIALASASGVRASPLLRRAHDGPRQADVPLARRRSNVAGRFAARRARGHILLVDDVFTTGSTAEACATSLRDAGADRVDVITWARTLRHTPRSGA
jgi:predicted amidophosphoribosyltransferase